MGHLIKSVMINRDTRDLVKNELNRISIVTDKDAIEQRMWIRLGINRGEWFLNNTLGVPWHDLLDNNATPEQIRAEVLAEMEKEEYVQKVEYVVIDEIYRSTRKLKLSFGVLLTIGDTITSSGEVNI